ncbi:MAG: ATP phosphoribosyltransferase regulatory subunit [Rhizobiaceae bacterium]
MLESLLRQLRSVAPDVLDVPILQPADPFLETAGEDLRRRIFITVAIDGAVQCLRPEFTIPICLGFVRRTTGAIEPHRYAYGGTVFRQARAGSSEFQQVGLEDLGDADRMTADARCLHDMLACLDVAGIASPRIILGDQKLFAVVVENLKLPSAIAKRLVRNFGVSRLIDDQIEKLTQVSEQTRADDIADQLALSGRVDDLEEEIQRKMNEAGMTPGVGRTPQAIAERMIEKARESHFQLGTDQAALLRDFLALELPLREADGALEEFAARRNLSFGKAGTNFRKRIEALETAQVDISRITYKASFGRNLEYYTGLLFEAQSNGLSVAGGGRYDRLCSLLGAVRPVPAVGFSMSVDRLEEAR